jgi:hypothetical protein
MSILAKFLVSKPFCCGKAGFLLYLCSASSSFFLGDTLESYF